MTRWLAVVGRGWYALVEALLAPFQARQRERAAFLSALERVCAVALAQTRVHQQQADALKAYFEMWRPEGMPESRVVREEDEYAAYLTRMGLTDDPARAAQFVLDRTEQDS